MYRHFHMIRTKPEFIVHVPKTCSVVPPVTEEVQFTTLPPDKHLQANSTLTHITTHTQMFYVPSISQVWVNKWYEPRINTGTEQEQHHIV